MKDVILIHGINGIPKIYYWLADELQKLDVSVFVPSFPPQEGALYEDWADMMDGYKQYLSNNSIIVCHSIGNEFVIKYLSKNQRPIDTYIGLAGFAETFTNEGKDVLNTAVRKFLVSNQEKRDFIALTNKRFAIYSDNDHIVPFDVLERYPSEIDATPIMIPGIGHMGKRSGLEQLPDLLKLIKSQL